MILCCRQWYLWHRRLCHSLVRSVLMVTVAFRFTKLPADLCLNNFFAPGLLRCIFFHTQLLPAACSSYLLYGTRVRRNGSLIAMILPGTL